jgi:GR25 family glycosyltransferase involved in LPS biosynthesis
MSSAGPAEAHIIHLKGAQEREELVEIMKCGWPWQPQPTVFSASDGTAWSADSGIAKAHPFTRAPVSKGVIGCAESHLDILYGRSLAYEDPASFIAILEDDCEFVVDPDQLRAFVDYVSSAQKEWDILLLGANEYVESEPVEGGVFAVQKVHRFWGTHAMLVRRRAAEAALRAFDTAQRAGVFLPADWMYNEAIKQHGLLCIGPTSPNALCRQAPGLVSSITGRRR